MRSKRRRAEKILVGVPNPLALESNPLPQASEAGNLSRKIPCLLDRTRELRANCRARKESNKQGQEKKKPKNSELFFTKLIIPS